MKVYNLLDLQKNSLLQALLHPAASAPGTPSIGQTYFNTGSDQLLIYGSGGWELNATDSALLQGQNGAYYLSRANHTGTQAASTISDLATTVQGYPLSAFAVPTADVAMGGYKLTGLSDPASAQDAATMGWVQSQMSSAAAGIDAKPSVRVVATTNQALTGTPTIDGVATQSDDRILLVGQTAPAENGVYVAAAGAWSRASLENDNGELTPGAFWYVEEGTTYGASQWRIENTGTITIDTTSITINQFGGGQLYSAGNGLDLTGSTFSVTADTGIAVTGSGVAIDTSLVARKKLFTVGDGASTALALTHNLGTKDVSVAVRLASTDEAIIVDWTATDTNTVTLNFAVAPASNAIKAVVVG